jgi:hypothetical protein
MRPPRYTLPVLGLVALLLLAGFVFYGRGRPVPVVPQFKPEDVRAIERDYRRLQRDSVHKAVASADLPSLCESVKELAFGRVRGIGISPDGRAVVSCGYIWNSEVNWAFALERTTNGWR